MPCGDEQVQQMYSTTAPAPTGSVVTENLEQNQKMSQLYRVDKQNNTSNINSSQSHSSKTRWKQNHEHSSP